MTEKLCIPGTDGWGHSALFFNPISQGVFDQRLVTGGGWSLGPRSYFQLMWTSFWTHGTIIDQFVVKGVH